MMLNFRPSDYETAKGMLIKTYGEPHHIEDHTVRAPEVTALFWNGKKANIQFWKGTTLHTLILGPSDFSIGKVGIGIHFNAVSTIE